MKKYFMKETGKEIQFGDIIVLDIENEGKDYKMHTECKFHPVLVETLLKQDVIEERECDDEEEEFEYEFPCAKMEELEDRIIELEGIVAELMDKLDE